LISRIPDSHDDITSMGIVRNFSQGVGQILQGLTNSTQPPLND